MTAGQALRHPWIAGRADSAAMIDEEDRRDDAVAAARDEDDREDATKMGVRDCRDVSMTEPARTAPTRKHFVVRANSPPRSRQRLRPRASMFTF